MTTESNHELAGFIRATFRSVWSIELLCLLQTPPVEDWSSTGLVAALRASQLVVSQSVGALMAAGLIVADDKGMVRYQPASQALGTLAQGAVELYRRSPDAVRRMIVSSAGSGIAAFADAFKFRKN